MDDQFWFEAVNISSFKDDYEVIKDLNLKLKYTDNVILLGPNGSGKSSIIDLICRNIYPVVEDKSIFKIFNKKLINLWELRKRISIVKSDIIKRINPDLLVFELILAGLHGKYCFVSKKGERDTFITENLINKMNLVHLSKKRFSYLSDGEKQISLFARALINNPEILILDEPVANLDYKSKFYVIDQINELSKLKTKLFCITHDITMITNIYNRIIMLKDRSIIADGSQKEIVNSENISNLYDIELNVMKENGIWNIYKKTK